MRIQLSSGQGPAECELAVGLLYEVLKREAPDIRLLNGINQFIIMVDWVFLL